MAFQAYKQIFAFFIIIIIIITTIIVVIINRVVNLSTLRQNILFQSHTQNFLKLPFRFLT